jgi:hypothetical protein
MAPSVARNSDKRQRHVKKQILLEEQREDQAADLRDRQANIAINSETPP